RRPPPPSLLPSPSLFLSARTVSGPPPDPNALRRDRPSDAAGWVILPADGRPGDPPEWPLLWQTQREYDLWKREWSRPQAVMWEADRKSTRLNSSHVKISY